LHFGKNALRISEDDMVWGGGGWDIKKGEDVEEKGRRMDYISYGNKKGKGGNETEQVRANTI
jgi:hypothetical protein